MALARHDATDGEERGRAETKLVRAENGSKDDIACKFQASVNAERETRTEARANQGVVRFAQTDFPGKPGVLDGSERRGASAAIVAANGDDVRAGLGDSGGDDANARAGNQLYTDAGARIHSAQVVDQLREVFNAVNIVMRRRRNQRSAGRGVANARDVFADFARGQLAAFAGLGALRHFDFELFGVDEVVGGDTKSRGSDLLDFVCCSGLEAIGVGIFATLTSVATASQLIHRQCQRAMRFGTQRAERHGLRAEALDDGFERFDFVDWNRSEEHTS